MTKAKKVTVKPGAIFLSKQFGRLVVNEITRGGNWKCRTDAGKMLTLSIEYLKACEVITAPKTSDPVLDEPCSGLDEPEEQDNIVDGEGNLIREIGAEPVVEAGKEDSIDVTFENENGTMEVGVIEDGDDGDAESRRVLAAVESAARDEQEEEEL